MDCHSFLPLFLNCNRDARQKQAEPKLEVTQGKRLKKLDICTKKYDLSGHKKMLGSFFANRVRDVKSCCGDC